MNKRELLKALIATLACTVLPAAKARARERNDVITACEECLAKKEATGSTYYTVPCLEYNDARGIVHCPECGKYRWQGLHGETKYDRSLIRAEVA